MPREIEITSLRNMRPMGSAGEMVHSRIQSIVNREGGAKAADILAEPVPMPGRSGIAWYSPGEAQYTPLSQLPDDEKTAALNELASIQQPLKTRRDELESAGTSSNDATLRALDIALTMAKGGQVWVNSAGEGPPFQITCWGYVDTDVATTTAATLRGLSNATPNVTTDDGPITSINQTPESATRASGGHPEFESTATATSSSADHPKEFSHGTQQRDVRSQTDVTTPMDSSEPYHESSYTQTVGVERVNSASSGSHLASAWTPWLSILTALGLLLLIWLLIPACGLRLPWGGVFYGYSYAGCDQSVAPSGNAQALRDEIAVLEEELRNRASSCETPPAALSQQEEALLDTTNTGELQISLFWRTKDDLDLIVMCPDNSKINFQSKTGCKGGVLDVDANAKRAQLISPAAENIVWRDIQAPAGQYRILVNLYKRNGKSGSVPFTVRLRQNGREQLFKSNVDKRQRPKQVHQFVR